MRRRLAGFMALGLLAGCAGSPANTPAPSTAVPAPSSGGCKQAVWQSETAPVINKRQGQEALERYDPENQAPGSGCP